MNEEQELRRIHAIDLTERLLEALKLNDMDMIVYEYVGLSAVVDAFIQDNVVSRELSERSGDASKSSSTSIHIHSPEELG